MKAIDVKMIAVGELKIADDNVREELGDLTELAASIESVGILEPLIVRDDMLVVCGTRRLAAAKVAGVKQVPVVVSAFTEEERVTVMAIENMQRQNLTPLEEARAFKRLTDLGLSMRQVAARLGVSQSQVSKRMSLLKLPEVAQAAVQTGTLELGQAQELTKVADDEKLVAKLVKKAEGGSKYTASDVERALEEKEKLKAARKVENELKKAGETVVKVEDDYYKPKPPEGMKIVAASGYYGDYVQMDPVEHAKLKCHALGVHPRTAEAVEICTDPGSHPDLKAEREKAEEKRRAQLAREKEQARLEAENRVEFLRSHLTGLKEKTVIDTCFRALVEDTGYSYSDGSFGLAILELSDEEVEEGSELDVSEELERKLLELAKTHAGKMRVTFAFACDRLWGQGDIEAVLSDLGYQPPTSTRKAKKAEEKVNAEVVAEVAEKVKEAIAGDE